MTSWLSFILFWALAWFAEPAPTEWTPLFNGQDFEGWQKYLGVPNAESKVPSLITDIDGNYISDLGLENDPLEVYSVVSKDGQPAIRISGEVSGTLNSTKEYSNFHLKLQYKWGDQKWPPRKDLPRDSGLLYHGHGEPGSVRLRWHHTQELQVQEGACGDYLPVGNVEMDIPATRTEPEGWYQYDPTSDQNRFVFGKDLKRRRCIKAKDNELPYGSWNTLELICWGDSSIHIVNGEVVMRLYKSVQIKRGLRRELRSGIVALQSEGAEVFYRNIFVKPLAGIPEEYAESE